MYYVVIREFRNEDIPLISDVVRRAYLSNVFNSWLNALFHELCFQSIIVLAAIMFIFMGVPLFYCILSVPIIIGMIYVIMHGAFLMKSAELMYTKRPLQCWVAEAYEPFFFHRDPKTCCYKIIPEEKLPGEDIDTEKLQRKIIGTVAVMKHNIQEDFGWLFRLAVDPKYRRKGIGLQLVQTVKNWSRNNKLNYLEMAMSECQADARQLFADAGFETKQLYHKDLFTSAFKLQMFQLRCEIRPTF